MYGSNELYQQISQDAGVQAVVSTYGAGEYMIFTGTVLPDTIVQSRSRTINLYPLGNFDHTLEYGEFNYTVNCRGPSESQAKETAAAVVAAINRRTRDTNQLFYAQTLAPIPPSDATDNFNVPVEVGVKARS